VSLWQGDGVFHNLDLDLEVLEQELNLPFSFVSGHINELLIHVPWTRIASEPVQITINTIECVMKLCPPGGRPPPPPERLRRQQSQPPDEQTPQSQSYRSSLVNKLICNLSITCNNFILKYVEEDIVLSMNIKNLSLSSVNEKWEPEITGTTLISLLLDNPTEQTVCFADCKQSHVNSDGRLL
ncbi:vacuolar protein sorting-associated protein 13B-like, partial [Nilaparvata lugens]|uniref:vacuolar protein sorting-associated protein 13B-like n=1 Tax=Nilaparvata lugens TaxID=108931 RepID=UPI00193DB21A